MMRKPDGHFLIMKRWKQNVEGIYVAGVVAAGYNNNEIFIENGRHHGGLIAEAIAEKIITSCWFLTDRK